MFGQQTQQQDLFSALFAPKTIHHNGKIAAHNHKNSIPAQILPQEHHEQMMKDPFSFMIPMFGQHQAPQEKKQFNFFEQPMHAVRQWLA